MIEDIVENMEYFSDVTQRTLSAFHVSGIDESLFEEINNIKRFIINSKIKTLITAKLLEDGRYERYFSDKSKDIVSVENLKESAFYDNKDYDFSLIEKCLSKEFSNITKIRFGEISCTEFKKIDRVSEQIFFM